MARAHRAARAAGGRRAALHRVDRAGPDLHLLGRARRDELPGVDAAPELRRVAEHSLAAQHVGHEVVREEGEIVDVLETPEAAPAESGRQVRDADLGALVERNLEAAVARHVPVQRHRCQELDEARGAPAGRPERPLESPGVALDEETAEVVQRAREERHQLRRVRRGGILTEDPRALPGVERAQLLGAPRPLRREVLLERGGDAEVARHPGALLQDGKPARAEVDRVEREDVREGRLRVASLPPRRVLPLRGSRALRELDAECLDAARIDAHRAGLLRHARAGLANPREDAGAHAGGPIIDRAPGSSSKRAGSVPSGSPSSSSGTAPGVAAASTTAPR